MPQGMGTCFSGSGSTFSPPAEHGLDFSSFFTNYEVFSRALRRAKASDPATAALTLDRVPLDHLPEPKPPTAGDSSPASDRTSRTGESPTHQRCGAAGGGRESLHFCGGGEDVGDKTLAAFNKSQSPLPK